MQIKALARATGIDAQTIRFYEKQGLLPAPARLGNGYRDYRAEHLQRLAFVRHCRALDMPLPEVKQLLAALDQVGVGCHDVDGLVDTQLVRVQARLASLRALEAQLLRLRRACDGARPEQGCGILDELAAAAQGEACACHPAAAAAAP